MRKYIKISAKKIVDYYKLKQHQPWFDKGCSELLVQRKETKLQWLHDPREINEDNVNNIRCEASRHFRKKSRNI
jgi:hypothetical protein